MTDLAALTKRNAQRWSVANLTRAVEFTPVARRLCAQKAKERYQAVEAKTGVPWFFIAVTHERESSQNFKTQLGQGDPLDRVSTHVPAGRGPFLGPTAWEDAAVDALVNCAPHAAHNRDWSIGALLTMLEEYNGLGYASKGIPSPYVWSGTDQYRSGKYVRDGVFDPNAVDRQLGCAGLLLAMQAIDPSISLGTVRPSSPPPSAPTPPTAIPSMQTPAVKNTARNATTGGVLVASMIGAMQAHRVEAILGIAFAGVLLAIAVHLLWPKKP